MTAPTPTTRSRGRPRRAQSLASDVRQQLLDATAQAFIARGYHGLSVELILSGAGISRPTFYKYFRNTDEAIDQVLARLNQELIEGMSQAVDQAGDARSTLEAALNYWRQWGRDLGPMLGALHAELHDRHSPASRHRLATLAILQARLEALLDGLGRPRPAPVMLELLITGIEFLVYRFHLQTPGDEASWQQTRDAVLRLVLGLLGTAQEWAMALPIAKALNLPLDDKDAGYGH